VGWRQSNLVKKLLTPERNAPIIDTWAEGISLKQTEVNDMNGSENQVAWANEILKDFLPLWNKNTDVALAGLAAKAAKSESTGKARSAEFARQDIATIQAARNTLSSVTDAAAVIDARGILNIGKLVHDGGTVGTLTMAVAINKSF
jgi:hypothetical protein